MAVSTGAQNAVLPLPGTFPTKTRCIQMQIPDDPEYFRLFYGAIESLSNWYAYDRDAMHSGKFVARAWSKALRSIHVCDTGVVTVGCGCDCDCCGDNMDWRQQGCELQKFDCLTGDWVTVYDSSLCTVNPAPGIGSIQPPGGSSADTCLPADSQALTPLPWVVNSGDVLDFTSIAGASTDPSLHWFCPDGSFFVLGACAGGGYTSGSDPLPTTRHEALLLKIGSNFYPVVAGSFTVPSGVVNLVPYIQVNNSNLATTSGKYSLCVTFHNNQTPPTTSWCQAFDFTISPHGFTIQTLTNGGACGTPTQPWGQWISGSYLRGTPATELDCTRTIDFGALVLDLGIVATITEVNFQGFEECGSTNNTVALQISNDPTFASGVTTMVYSIGDAAGTNYNLTNVATFTGRYVRIYLLNEGDSPGGCTALATCKSLKLLGTGTNPFTTSNC